VFRVCSDFDGNTHYFVREPDATIAGVCEIFEDEIFPAQQKAISLRRSPAGPYGQKLNGFTWDVPQVWSQLGYLPLNQDMAVVMMKVLPKGQNHCPRADNQGYNSVKNVPPGFYKAMSDALEKKIASDRNWANRVAVEVRSPNQLDHNVYAQLAGAACTISSCSAKLTNGWDVQFEMRDGKLVVTTATFAIQ